MITRRQLLIWSALSLATGYAAPAFAQVHPGPISTSGWGKGFATANTTLNCSFENTGMPWSGMYGYGDIHGQEVCDTLDIDTDLYHTYTLGYTACWRDAFTRGPGGLTQWAGLYFNPNRQLYYLGGSNGEGIYGFGWWHSRTPPDITWDQFRAGTPIEARLSWVHESEWIAFDFWARYEEFGYSNPGWENFEIRFGIRPWEADMMLRVEWDGPADCTFYGEFLFCGRVTITQEFVPTACRSDLNRDGVCDTADLFLFLRDWFNDWARGDWDASGGCEAADVFCFLTDWFTQR